MSRKSVILPFMLIFMMALSTLVSGDYQLGKTYHGFKLKEKRFVKEVNADCYYFEHEKSGARLLKIATDDVNKTFSISFKTVPESDAGTPHIMEHSVLNGSKNFPVKSPFDVLAKGSLNTFLNAMTGSDITIYPVASMNEKDYFNLMHVYLDAVFNPLIYDDPRILQQEGWHHELESADAPVVYKGVVYNEMKGAYSSPTRELGYQVDLNLFPDNGYHFSSGGYPRAIPTLTYEAFLDFHRKYYHPSNSYIYLYGNADMDRELEFIDRAYLANYDRSKFVVDIPIQKPFPQMKVVDTWYAASENSSVDNQTYLTLNFVAGLNTDQQLVWALNVLSDVLVNQESAPVRLALQEAGIGKEVRASVDDLQQNVFQIMVQNANPGDRDKFKEIVFNTLREVAQNGVDMEAVQGTLNRLEFRLREGNDAQKGLTYNFQSIANWFFAGDPFKGLEYEKPLATIKKAINEGYLESVIKKELLDNTHSLLLTMAPKPGLESQITEEVEVELAAFKSSLSGDDVSNLVKNTNDLIEYQQREDDPEALETIPMLALSDIKEDVEWYGVSENKVNDVLVLHHDTFTNNVVYGRFFYDLRVLPDNLLPYAGLLAEVMGSLNTRNYAYGDLDKALKIHTGGFATYLDSYLEDRRDENLLPKYVVSVKAMNDKTGKMFELVDEIVNNTQYGDKERLKAVLTRHQSRLDARAKQDGISLAMGRLASYYSEAGKFEEITGGVEYYWFITDLASNYETKYDEIRANLEKTAQLLFTNQNLIAAATCAAADFEDFTKQLSVLADKRSGETVNYANWNLKLEKKNEGLLTASKVQYVVTGYDFKKLGYEFNGKMWVMNQALSREYLNQKLRVIGGAYGGFSGFNSNGTAFMASYRDPNLKETVENYEGAPKFLAEFEADASELTRLIIGTISRLDRPITPSQQGDRAFRYYFEKVKKEQLQKDRAAVLTTTVQDIRGMQKMVADILAQKTLCVYGNEEKIKENKTLFKELVPLDKTQEINL